ncbi:putative F420-dependent oxidoreductase, MSMEG_4141 family [Mycobacteroides abscessus subsp. abscessus]|uniref:Luciferase-like domain-containing protein n=6 Tax=Mycobacteroides abscessus TaxID=36809 RepID=B1MGA8_MYCA9|nr:LLM class F420-dependent oxidoreductase [Mycobacteroides abscessus]ETZ90884.1 F420-dependent oxidoreductase family protein [Mycobacteroides abscessus MAB_030201_1075]ETZ93478.1 F420-dependent oxidoreductase family protein [Mycobacteroides abscessus MAB_030201_1061]EUA44972.1 F420-dependent oxidoreductase family protein [Mycobacteroides abscessus 21]ALM17926.1 LLM class F420-dependent oxidoreductase [Mycobacteroides abscessus]AMU47087.1 LLM class F420-dependent oxidoreductase [Mycobacteroide
MGESKLNRYGVWKGGPVTPEQARTIEDLGYGSVWVGGVFTADLAYVEPLLAVTENLTVASGIVNIWTSPVDEIAAAFHRIEAAYPGRFLLGVGAGHPEASAEYRKPYDALVEYLDGLDAAGVPKERRVLAALGPKVLKLSADRTAGAHPYLTTPEHTRQAREIIGPDALLVPEHKVVLSTDAPSAREIGRRTVDFYLTLSNYVNNWKRLGFNDEDLTSPGSDAFIDAVVAHGTAAEIATRLNEHLDAGADQVLIQVLGDKGLVDTLTSLADALR